MGDGTVMVVLPEISEERLSSRARSRGDKARRGWIRSLSGTNKGGFALLAEGDTFLRPGENLQRVGAVIALVDFDGEVRLAKVSPAGRLLKARGADGKFLVWDLHRSTVSLCAEADRLLALDPAAHLRETMELIDALPPERTEGQIADLEHARGLLAAMSVASEGPSRGDLLAERASLLARLAEVDAALASKP
jgi:hypothetical protein